MCLWNRQTNLKPTSSDLFPFSAESQTNSDMAAAGHVRSEDLFLCSICENVFTDPVTTSCGHNFCKSCISEHWRVNVPYQCPMCKEDFDTKPQLKINTLFSEMVAQFRPKEQKAELKKTEGEIEQMILERQMKILEIQWSVEVSKNAADREAAEGVKVYTALMETVQRSLNQLIEEIQEKQRTTKEKAEDFIKKLEQEIYELEKRSTEVE
ncbi:E3 ubiquitin-protein ligase TRIM17-like [Sphaeramia orbicularis]|uniref:E3 ubiquitin-protein ligase TRIM17-like n=1 Tax=Sphaeramia orbicularis TaxID=375764 RepID=UPI00117E60B2|nr:E3 ubiquitin-protein ligase TRIM17-like [Sphaeramia orbicularis]